MYGEKVLGNPDKKHCRAQTIQGYYYYYLDRGVISLTSHGAKTFLFKDKQRLPN